MQCAPSNIRPLMTGLPASCPGATRCAQDRQRPQVRPLRSVWPLHLAITALGAGMRMSGCLGIPGDINEGASLWVPRPLGVADAMPPNARMKFLAKDDTTGFPLDVRASINRNRPLCSQPFAHGWLPHLQSSRERGLIPEVVYGPLDGCLN